MKDTYNAKSILRAQRRLIVGYLVALLTLAVSVALMPTKLLVWGGIYGHSILFWLSLIGIIVCYIRFKRKNAYFKKSRARLPTKALVLFRNKKSMWLLIATAAAFVVFLILQSTVGAHTRFILFAACVFLLGLYLGGNSYEYHIYRKHLQKSHVRRDENE